MRVTSLLFLFSVLIACSNAKNEQQKASPLVKGLAATNVPDKVSTADSAMGSHVFFSTCNSCHRDSIGLQAPSPAILRMMPTRAIYTALVSGKMQEQAKNLSDAQRKAVAQWITNRVFKENTLPEAAYTAFSLQGTEAVSSGWGGGLEGTGFYPTEMAGITAANVSSLKLKWAFAFPDVNIVRSRPAVVGDWLVVGSHVGDVFTINKQSGKVGWHFAADAPVRGAVQVVKEGEQLTAFFADYSTNTYAVNVKTGKLIWKKRAGIHPQSGVTGSVVVYDGLVYVPLTSAEVTAVLNPEFDCCTSSGGVMALDAKTGEERWQYRVIAEPAKVSGKKKNGKSFYGPSGAPVWNSPTVDAKRGLLYIGTGENYTYPPTASSDAVQALDLKTGKLVWSFQGTRNDTWNLACPDGANCPTPTGPDVDFGMAPLLVTRPDGKEVLVVGQKSGDVYSLEPASGRLLWKTKVGKGGALGGIHWGMATDGKYVYAANADNINGLGAVDTHPEDKPAPGLYALDLLTGKVVWKAAAPPCDTSRKGCVQANSAAPIVMPGVVLAGALDGHIRAYAAADGKVLWDFDTVKDYETVNSIKGYGGALDGSAPVVSNGMLFINSGYGMFGEMPGNVLLAFEVGK
jgi:polyvinyl alcohol dehydrogenase (cytochrome)